ncbi:hypothetical protein COU57_02080 [Candidatus Pacearchaeota archaeon CG10_big_fil_rev_8_21_14_0_10_32_14]|nr:MAG: hypothetical protein COU57_02080 [Candidatus Pacearchaeota archaeon CG10_big_fil_rev_8_21_14_0_10_32_14]
MVKLANVTILIAIVLLVNLTLVLAEIQSSHNNHSNIDPFILNKFNKNTRWMSVNIILNNMSSESQIDFVNKYSSKNFKVRKSFFKKVSSNKKIVATINKVTLTQLIDDDSVKVIYYQNKFLKEFNKREILQSTINDPLNNSSLNNNSIVYPYVSPDVYNELEKSQWVPVVIQFRTPGTTDLNSIIENLSSKNVVLLDVLLKGDSFSGKINKGGLQELIENPFIVKILYNRVTGIDLN